MVNSSPPGQDGRGIPVLVFTCLVGPIEKKYFEYEFPFL